ncbi:putative E3 ubiquitin-protein ligase XBAT34 isoform X3 [Jatropha curcas]|uniref:putative E3 ubiquitin-protein ligase XBAT34 isoform X3 n=1 Tax=Jatropha curcas TaxID=180498 RepID=UPI0005FB8321|nr:putative E3 ubiquitin-protein ligase XBAT34 isoform X3 [Jatropha curcas]
MGQQQSKDELVYQQVNYGNTEGIKSLRSEGAGLEWIDKEGKTPLILACLNPELFNVAKTLIELGANVNAYRFGRNAGTPLHHAAKRGLVNTVKLLLSHGANALVINDDCQTPLDVARFKGHTDVVRVIENHICLFSGWMREFFGPGFLEVLAPQFLSRKVWVVILPTGSRNPTKPFKLELAIYSSPQDARPRTMIPLWKANLEEPKFQHSDPSVIIAEYHTKTRIKLAPANEGDKQQLQWFCDACKGIPQATHPPAFLHNSETSTIQATAPPSAEDLELAMAINASIHSAMAEVAVIDTYSAEASASTSWNEPVNSSSQSTLNAPVIPSKATSSFWAAHEASPSDTSTQQNEVQNSNIPAVQNATHAPDLAPSAPPTFDEIVEDGPIHYPSIDSSPIDISSPPMENLPASTGEKKEDGSSSSCVICLDAPVEGACVPCGHMAGCMSCLKEVKAKKWGCPVCRAKIDQIIRLYAV